jgi:hypothetical protein
MPLGRLSTAALVQLAGRQTALPYVIAWQGPLALLGGMGLLYLFVRRELGHPFYGLLAMVFFGITSVYHQAVSWFAASFSILAMDTMLLALLAAQKWRRTGRLWDLVWCGVWAALAPGWFASGILAGPLCCLYLLPWEGARNDVKEFKDIKDERDEAALSLRFFRFLADGTLTPLLGSAAFLAISLPYTAERIMHARHYENTTALNAFAPLLGLVRTARSLVDNLALGVFGISGLHCPVPLVPLVLTLLAVLLWRWCPRRQWHVAILGLGFILLSYVLSYSARAQWDYDDNMNSTAWGRYHLFPQLGLTLLLCAGLPELQGRLFRLEAGGRLSREQARFLELLTALLFAIQVPRELLGTLKYEPVQGEILRTIEEVDGRCRARHVGAQQARAVMRKWQAQYHPVLNAVGLLGAPKAAVPFVAASIGLTANSVFHLPYCGEEEDAWELLRGSDDPRPMSDEVVLGLLLADPTGSH